MTWANPISSSTVSPFIRSAVRKAAICAFVAPPLMTASIAAAASMRVRSRRSTSVLSASAMIGLVMGRLVYRAPPPALTGRGPPPTVGPRSSRKRPAEKGAHAMPTYILLTKLTESGRRTVKKKPNRTKEVNREIEQMGGKVVAQYAVLGPYDYVNVVEAPNNETIAKISMELGSRGTTEIMTLAAVNLPG